MARFSVLFLIVSVFVGGSLFVASAIKVRFVVNERPIIGILSQEVYNASDYSIPPSKSYIAASYVQYLEGAGARVVPIEIHKDEDYLRTILKGINGLLIPGGAILFEFDNGTINNSTKGYVKSGLFLLKLAKEANDNGDYFPVWGTCLGFELMLFDETNGAEFRTLCKAKNQVDKLRFQQDAMSSQLFGTARKSIVNIFSSQPVAANFHHFCVTPENFRNFGLDKSYKLLSTSFDPEANVTYVSAVEGKHYPFFGVQFHPEKNIYEWTKKENLPHSPDAIEAAQYLAMFFTDQARKNSHKFKSEAEEQANLIYNFVPTYSGYEEGSTFNQKYYFPF